MDLGFPVLRQNVASCARCGLCKTRTNAVFGVGDEAAKILFVGEAPGRREDELGEPFVGESGKLLDLYLGSIGLTREKGIFIANILKCRPPMNRDPEPDEIAACLPHLRALYKVLDPKIVVCVGRIAAKTLIDPDFRVTREHGVWRQKGGVWFMGTYHPSALLRDPSKKGACLEDFLSIEEKMKELGLRE